MKTQKLNSRAFLLTAIALLTAISLVACDENKIVETTNNSEIVFETTEILEDNNHFIAYNNDGTVNYEEFYYEDGTISKRIEYTPDSLLTTITETEFDQSGKMTIQTLYMGGYLSVKKYDTAENCVEIVLYRTENKDIIGITVLEYDNNSNLTKQTVTDKDNNIIVTSEYTYNEYGALIGENRFERGRAMTSSGPAIVNWTRETKIEPEDSTSKHNHIFNINLAEGWRVRDYSKFFKDNKESLDYEHILSVTIYINDILSGTLNREYTENGDFLIHEIVYNDDGSINYERFYDKDGNKK